ncbi:MAG TPA: alpha/beta hydrolase, partial [Gaiellaceae bacterium]
MPDERIEAAIAHWAPRFTSQGVDMNDFLAVTSGLEQWPEWLPAWVANGDMHAELAQDAEDQGRALTAGEAYVRAALSYHFAKFVWMVDFDLYVDATRRAIDALYAAHRLLDPTAERVEIPFEGTTMAGNLRRPSGAECAPLVLLLPGLDSTKEEFFHWENVFLERGLATFSLDG